MVFLGFRYGRLLSHLLSELNFLLVLFFIHVDITFLDYHDSKLEIIGVGLLFRSKGQGWRRWIVRGLVHDSLLCSLQKITLFKRKYQLIVFG